MTAIRRETLVIAMVLLHLFAVPCATAMVLMPADADCEHCLTTDGADACLVSSASAGASIENLAFDSGRAEPPQLAMTILSSIPVVQRASSQAVPADSTGSRTSARPLYLLLGQFLI